MVELARLPIKSNSIKVHQGGPLQLLMQIIQLTKQNRNDVIQKAITVLQSGGLVIYPTETCYGVGVDATNQIAVGKLLQYKDRPEGKAISIALASEAMAAKYVEINDTAKNLYRHFLPGPLTVISKSKKNIAKGLEAENGTLGVRIPQYGLMVQTIELFGKPITATSANASGKKTPYAIGDIFNNISKKQKGLIDLVIDAGELPRNPPSTVVDTTLNDVSLIRQGELHLQSLNGQTQSFYSLSEEHTKEIAEKLMTELKSKLSNMCVIFALQGELGAGKTQFAKGVGKALGITANINSPTFTLMNEFPFNGSNFYHIDTWRMHEGSELLELGFEQMIKSGNVIVIEWLQKVKEILDKTVNKKEARIVWVDMQHQSLTTRSIKILY